MYPSGVGRLYADDLVVKIAGAWARESRPLTLMDTIAEASFENGRRRWLRSADEQQRIIAETYDRGASASEVAQRHGVNANLLYTWRRVMGGLRRHLRRSRPGLCRR